MHIQWYLAITVATSLIGFSTVNNNFKIDDSFFKLLSPNCNKFYSANNSLTIDSNLKKGDCNS